MDDSINACVKYWLGYIFPKTCKEEKVVANKNVFFNLDLFFFNHTYGHFFPDVVGSIRACSSVPVISPASTYLAVSLHW